MNIDNKIWLIIIFIVLLGYFLHLYHHKVKTLMRRINERERSIDDMLKLVEAKCDEAKAIAKNKSEFLSNMSHEIRTPINTVLGMNEMILRECEDDVIYSYAYHVKNSGNMLLSLVNDILDFSKIESGKMELVLVNYQLLSLINDLVSMANSKLRDKDLKLILDIDPTLPSELHGDDVRLKQILVNLLTNAIKYTPHGSITLRITGEQKDNFFVFRYEVEDTGLGIKEEDLVKLCEKFVRFDQKKNKNIEGTGLGLNITNRLLELMDSKLQVNSVYEKGSVFYFDLEQKITNFTPIGKFEYRFDDHAIGEKYEVGFIAPDANVLVVDDNEMNRNVFRALLKETLIKIDEADSGKQCLEKIREKKYDLIFMDHMMPEMDGIETLHKLKESKHHYNCDTPVIILTANAISGAKEKYLQEGFEDFLSKPIIPDKLENIIRNWLPENLIQQGASKKKKEEKMNLENMPSVEGLDWNYAALHFPDMETLMGTVEAFYRALIAEGNKLKEFYEEYIRNENDEILDAFRIQVHAMKSSANVIGLTPLSGFAAMLEYAARDHDVEMIKEATPHFLKNWYRYKEKIKPCVAEAEKSNIIDQEKMKDALQELVSAIETFDIDLSDQIMNYVRLVQFDEEAQNVVDELEAAVVDLDGDAVADLVNRLIEKVCR